jgi:hypothetical protein
MKLTINNPFIKDPANIAWLEENYETFLDYMSKHHSLADCWHTVLNIATFDDDYIKGMIKNVEAADKRGIREEQKRKRKIKGLKTETDKNATSIEKKQALIEEAVEAKRKEAEDDELPD